MVLQTEEMTTVHQLVVINAPEYKLYGTKAVVIATFFGSALAGGYLMAKNYQRLGNKTGAKQALIYTFLAVIASLIAGYLLPESVPPFAVSLPVLVTMGQATKQLQGPAFEQHLQNHGQYESCWKAWGISLLFMVAVAVIAFAGFTLLLPGEF